jgi:hypothetical protein
MVFPVYFHVHAGSCHTFESNLVRKVVIIDRVFPYAIYLIQKLSVFSLKCFRKARIPRKFGIPSAAQKDAKDNLRV